MLATNVWRLIALLAAVASVVGCAADTCSEEGLAAALEGAGASSVVAVGDCEVETTGLVVPAGVTLEGTGEASRVVGVGAGPAVTLEDGAAITDLEIRAEAGVAVAAFGVESARLSDVTIVGPVTAANVTEFPVAATATRIGLLIRDGGAAGAPVELERVAVRGFPDVGVALVSSHVRWEEGEVSGGLGSGLLASGGRTELRAVTLRGMLQEGRLSATYAGVFLDGADVDSDGLTVADNAGGGLMHDRASAAHRGIAVHDNTLLGVWTQHATSFELSGASSLLEGNGRVALAIHEPAGPHVVSDATIADTVEVPSAVGRWGLDGVADGIHLVGDDTPDVTLSGLELRGNIRAGALLHVRGGTVDPATLSAVTADATGSAFGVVAQDDAGSIPSGAWDTDVTRTGAAATNDVSAPALDILTIVQPMGLPVPPS